MPLPLINLRASPLDLQKFNNLSVSIIAIESFVILSMGRFSFNLELLKVSNAVSEDFIAASFPLHSFVTSFARRILASLIFAPLSFSNS